MFNLTVLLIFFSYINLLIFLTSLISFLWNLFHFLVDNIFLFSLISVSFLIFSMASDLSSHVVKGGKG